MALDPKVQKLLNDFSKSQPALNLAGVPASKSGVKLGDLIAAAAAGAAAPTTTYTPTVTANWTGADPTNLQDALDRVAAALVAAGHTP